MRRALIPLSKNLGAALIFLSLIFLLTIYLPIFSKELKYLFDSNKNSRAVEVKGSSVTSESEGGVYIRPVDNEFSIIIPKIDINERVIANVDPFNSSLYQQKLSKGVAHAKGSSLPDQEKGNSFLFSHSSSNPFEAERWNSTFYLIYKLEKGDEIYIKYKNALYQYKVEKLEKVSPKRVDLLNSTSQRKKLTLMTCWPPGVDTKRLVVTAYSSR